MAKPKSPLLSLGAKGTIGDALTFQKRGRDTIARTKPIPRDPYSLNQAYQRWDYRDYAHMWTLLSNSEKQVYRTKASRYHITGFSQFMRESLKALTDIVGRWHLDERSGATAYDSSKNTNNGAIIGASPTPGYIDGAFLFDGLNDGIAVPTSPSLNLVSPFSIEFFIYLNAKDKLVYPLYKKDAYSIPLRNINDIGLGITGAVAVWSDYFLTTHTLYHVVITYDSSLASDNATFFINGSLIAAKDRAIEPPVSTFGLGIGAHLDNADLPDDNYVDGIMDEVVIHTRILDEATIKRHSERRYPS